MSKDIVPKMTSLPEGAKEFLKECGSGIYFHDQVLLMEFNPMDECYYATSYIPTWYDIFDESWTVC